MFVALLIVTFLLALVISLGIAWVFTKPLELVLQRLVKTELTSAWSRYLRFTMIVIGVSSGTRIQPLERYINAPSWTKETLKAGLTQEYWAAELYHTVSDSIVGIAWLLLLFVVIGIIAFIMLGKKTQQQAEAMSNEEKLAAADPRNRVTKIR
jgi:hypothetical protein